MINKTKQIVLLRALIHRPRRPKRPSWPSSSWPRPAAGAHRRHRCRRRRGCRPSPSRRSDRPVWPWLGDAHALTRRSTSRSTACYLFN